MNYNLLKQIIRNLWKRKLTNSINLFGIVMGLSVSSLLLLYTVSEFSSNNFFPNYENIYRVDSNWGKKLSIKHATLLRQHVPEIEHLTLYQYSWSWKDLIKYNAVDYNIKDAVYADSVFFKVLQFKPLYGDLKSALDSKYSMVITKSEAERIFGTANVVGKVVPFKASNFGINKYTIKAVINDLPTNCSFKFQVVVSLNSLLDLESYSYNVNYWGTMNFSAFAMLANGSSNKVVEEKMNLAANKHTPENSRGHLPYHLNSIEGLHFDSKGGDGVFITNKKSTVFILGGLGLLILLLAGINYFNLNIAQIEDSNIEIGIRKTIGANSFNIGYQSFLSTIILFVFAIVVSSFVVALILPPFNSFTGSSFVLTDFLTPANMFFLVGFLIVSGLLFGIFPAIFSAKHSPITAISKKSNLKNIGFAKYGLVTLQFFLAIVLISSTLMLNKQNSFLVNSNYGYNKENILYVPIGTEALPKINVLENEFENEAVVKEVAFGSGVFGEVNNRWGRNMFCKGEKTHINFSVMWVCRDFFKLFGLEVVEGNGFGNESYRNKDIIYNQAFFKKYSIKEPFSSCLAEDGSKHRTVGIIKDFKFNSLKHNIEPIGFICEKKEAEVLFVKFAQASPQKIHQTIKKFEKIWKNVSPNYPFEYHFLDKHYETVYEKEIKLMKVFAVGSVLAILIASLGLFCIAYIVIGKRIKEIGIRKVNGAKVSEILVTINKEFVVWISMSFILACPVFYYAMNKWLENFAFKTTISFGIFVLSGLIVLGIALLTISWQSWKAATRNPVEALRYE